MKLRIVFIAFFLALTVNSQQQITDFSYEGVVPIDPKDYIEFNNLIFFNASTSDYGREIWVSDGTIENTTLLKDIYPGNEDGAPYPLNTSSAILNGELYFIATDGSSNGELWKTDGTSSGTLQVTDFLDSGYAVLTTVGNHIFFLQKPEVYLLQVWKSDGTSEGTILIKDNLPVWNYPTFYGSINDTFIFTFQPQGTGNSRVWRSDGTTAGTFPVTGEIDGNGSGPGGTPALSQYIKYNDKLYFVSRYHLYETDGTLQNTNVVANLWNAQSDIVKFSDAIVVNNKMYFLFYSFENYQLSIWESDGTEEGSIEIYNEYRYYYYFPSFMTHRNNSLVFSGPNQNEGTSLLSLNLNNYEISELFEFNYDIVSPQSYISHYQTGVIYKITDDVDFISTLIGNPLDFERKGWIVDYATNTMTNIEPLDHIIHAIVKNQVLYYTKDKQVWKYEEYLNTESIEPQSSLKLYPNPASESIAFNVNSGIDRINIFDMQGRLVINIPNYNHNKIDISGLYQGTYLVQIEYLGNYITMKLVKK